MREMVTLFVAFVKLLSYNFELNYHLNRINGKCKATPENQISYLKFCFESGFWGYDDDKIHFMKLALILVLELEFRLQFHRKMKRCGVFWRLESPLHLGSHRQRRRRNHQLTSVTMLQQQQQQQSPPPATARPASAGIVSRSGTPGRGGRWMESREWRAPRRARRLLLHLSPPRPFYNTHTGLPACRPSYELLSRLTTVNTAGRYYVMTHNLC